MMRRLVVQTGVGVHARPASLVVREAAKCGFPVTLECRGKRADAKSILQVLALGVRDGEELTVYAEGEGEEQVLVAIAGILTKPSACG